MCVFCDIVEGKIPSSKVYEDENYLAFKDINPKAPVHILIIPKKHIGYLSEVDESNKHIIGDMAVIANKIAKDLGIAESGYRIVINNGPDSGQEVFHLHMHLLGGKKMSFSV
ncbi:histidine triad nucleotide-binding protein [Hippea jasoniae]|uniref:histidine triad nucleotide-binding protein n=1 Tax=Hippea jasoniae TaxID=944479 RepID=UPI000554DEF8|nr:histidine triad nucleotide-binding protein [Hippea jasoniae]